MNREHERILVECLRRTEENAAWEPPAWRQWDVLERLDQVEHGPRYGCGAWFGPVTEAQRMRYRRALDDLACDGLLTLVRTGPRLTHVKLTEDGMHVARELAGRQPAAQDDLGAGI